MTATNINNLVSISALQEQKQISNYYSSLEFHELLNESQDILDILGRFPANTDLAQKTKILMRELNNRLEKNSHSHSKSLQVIRGNSSHKIDSLIFGI